MIIGKTITIKEAKNNTLNKIIGIVIDETKNTLTLQKNTGTNVTKNTITIIKEHIITIEEGTIAGGFGSAVSELLSANGIKTPLSILGVPDQFMEHAKPQIQKQLAGINRESIMKAIQKALKDR